VTVGLAASIHARLLNRAKARGEDFNLILTRYAIAATFQRRGTAVPVEVPLGLSDEFAHDAAKRAQWKAFLGKNRLDAPTLDEVIGEVRHFVTEPLKLARQRKGAL